MEIFLNVVWLCVALAFTGLWIGAVVRGKSKAGWSTVVALALLLLLLFPVISMTDDLIAMNAPAEAEHAFRRHDAPLQHAPSVGLTEAFAWLAMAVLGAIVCLVVATRVVCRGISAKLREGFVRAMGLRPPPAFLLLGA